MIYNIYKSFNVSIIIHARLYEGTIFRDFLSLMWFDRIQQDNTRQSNWLQHIYDLSKRLGDGYKYTIGKYSTVHPKTTSISSTNRYLTLTEIKLIKYSKVNLLCKILLFDEEKIAAETLQMAANSLIQIYNNVLPLLLELKSYFYCNLLGVLQYVVKNVSSIGDNIKLSLCKIIEDLEGKNSLSSSS